MKVNSHSALQSLRYAEHESEDHKSSEIEQLKLDLKLALAQADQERAITAQKVEQLWARPDSPGGLWPTQILCHNKGLQKQHEVIYPYSTFNNANLLAHHIINYNMIPLHAQVSRSVG